MGLDILIVEIDADIPASIKIGDPSPPLMFASKAHFLCRIIVTSSVTSASPHLPPPQKKGEKNRNNDGSNHVTNS